MNLTPEQMEAIKGGQAVPCTLDHTECVVLRKDIYERVSRVVEFDRPLTAEEKRFLLQQAGERAGWNDPEMSVYDDLDPRK
jgi:hypothetical protein